MSLLDPVHPGGQWREPVPRRRSAVDRRIDLAATLTAGAGAGTGDPGRGRSRRELAERLDTTQVVVAVDPADGEPALRAAAALVSMAARVVGQVSAPPLPLELPNPWSAPTLAAVIEASSVRGPARTVERTITVGIGRATGAPGYGEYAAARPRNGHARTNGHGHDRDVDIAFGGDDWTAVVTRDRPAAVGPCPLGGMGLQAAAALAFGEVMKDLLGPMGMRHVGLDGFFGSDAVNGPAGHLVWNLVDGSLGPRPVPPPAADRRVWVPKVALLGAGSIGSSAAAVLSMTRVLGRVNVVDPDRFDPVHNAYRCPGVPAATTVAKADWAARLLAARGWNARAHRQSIAEWDATRDERGFAGIALVSVDNVDGRRDAGDLVAETTVSAGAGGTALHVHRHVAGDDLACPYCDLVDARRWRDQAAVYARLGLTLPRLEALLGGERLSVDDVATAIWTGSVDPRAMDDLPGGQLGDLLARHYATIGVPASAAPGQGATGTARVSAPHVSWLGGTLLATEVVKAAIGMPGLDRRVELDLCGIPLGGWRRPRRDPTGRCPCTQPSRRELARSLYDHPDRPHGADRPDSGDR
jgi:hypothetical protein